MRSALMLCLAATAPMGASKNLRSSMPEVTPEKQDFTPLPFRPLQGPPNAGSFTTTTTQYVAAVAQHESLGSSSSDGWESVVDMNVNEYRNIAAAASAEGAQIIVFPEWGLFGTDGAVKSRNTIEPFCETISDQAASDSTTTVGKLSTLAAKYGVVVVANVCEKVETESAVYLYNTEIALSEKGELLAKYHKEHPWYTDTFDTPTKEEIVTFTTSFGVRFGLFICYDIVHSTPINDLLAEGVTQFPYSVSFPVDSLEKVGFQAWSKHTKATLLASNLGGSGSGIFQKGDVIAAVGRTGAKFAIGPVVIDGWM
ncbi:hypothetical protein TrST_g14204 [Triparma strigata]|uniref:CN hydrolase domain-containing protein n=1 Tax=Triparma strigata TaxID=1606541 RepID=A0A9W7BZH0_9STRA|nr:hypothetical protein TrST_g14204 [Triparma strigata]